MRHLSAFFLLALLWFQPSLSAQHATCATDTLWRLHLLQNPEVQLQQDALEAYRYAQLNKGLDDNADGPAAYTLPVVVHIIHNGGAENISDAQVQQGIAHLNAAFANTGGYDDGDGIMTPFQFCLAQRTPTGAPTNGINRVVSNLTTMFMEVHDLPVKDLSRWDPKHYINIWLVQEIISIGGGDAVAGYAFLPGAHGQAKDGIMMEARWFGSSEGNSVVTIHEMGHYLGLLHTFEGGCMNNDCNANGDRVCDTPPDQSTAWQPCGAVENTCSTDTDSGFLTDQPDMTTNYMDYAKLECSSVFTQGQSSRMEFFLKGARKSLLQSIGCLPACPNPVTANFVPSAGATIPAGTVVDFANNSLNASTYQWYVNNVLTSTATTFNYQFNSIGTVVVRLRATGADSTCFETALDTFQVICPLESAFTASIIKPEVGDSVQFEALPSSATQWEWTLNGVVISTTAAALWVVNNPGVYTLCLTTSDGFCAVTLCKTIDVKNPDVCDGNLFRVTEDGYVAECMLRLPNGSWLAGGSLLGDSSAIFHLSPEFDFSGGVVINGLPGQSEFIDALVATSDGFVVGVGYSATWYLDQQEKVFFFKYDYINKALVWIRAYQSSAFKFFQERTYLTELTTNGNFYVTSVNDANGFSNFYLEINKNTGAVVDARSIQNPLAFLQLYHLEAVADGFYTTGFYGKGVTDQGPVLNRYDGLGQLMWSKYYSNPQFVAYGYGLTILENEVYIMADGSGNNTYSIVIKTDLDGNLIWSKKLDLPFNTSAVDGKNIVSVSDGVIMQYSPPLSPTPKTSYLIKMDTAGNVVWRKTLDLPEDFYINNMYAYGDRLVLLADEWFSNLSYFIRLDPEAPVINPCILLENSSLPDADFPVTPTPAPYNSSALAYNSVPANNQVALLQSVCQDLCPPGACGEICDNEIDDDQDGYVDCFDLADCPCNVPVPDCATTDTLENKLVARVNWASDPQGINTTSTPIISNLNPLADSIPEILVLQFNATAGNNQSDKILIFQGDGSNATTPDVLQIAGSVLVLPVNYPVVGDLNRDGIPELVVVCADRYIRVFSHYQQGASVPMALWATSLQQVADMGLRPALADFNGDGVPEIMAGTEVFQLNLDNPAAPVLSRPGSINQSPYGRLNTTVTTSFTNNAVAVDLLSVIDCSGDPDCGGLEIAAGNAIYSVDLDPLDGDPVQIKKQIDLNLLVPGSAFSDGYTSVADVDLDGTLDVIVSGRRGNGSGVYVWNKFGLLRFFAYPNGATRGGGIVSVGNVYNDLAAGATQDFPEMLASCENRLVCFNLNKAAQTPATPWWWVENTADLSGMLGASLFDFNNDKRPEILLRDQNGARMMYGGAAPYPPGVDANRNWSVIPMGSGTLDEYPVVADLDADGQSEIAITGHGAPGVPPIGATTGQLWVLESDPNLGAPWLPSRPLWNQFGYFYVPILDDGTVPKVQQPPHLEIPGVGSGNRPLNQFLAQLPLHNGQFEPFLPLPDATVAIDSVVCGGDSMRLSIQICNAGSTILPGEMPWRVYLGNPTSGTAALLSATPTLETALPPGNCRNLSITLPTVLDQMLYVVVNDNGSLIPPFDPELQFPINGILECDYGNNVANIAAPQTQLPLDLGPDVAVCANGIWTFDAGAGYAAYRWSNLSEERAITVFLPGKYWVETRDICGGIYTDTVEITVLPGTGIELGPDTSLCIGATLAMNLPGFETYQWLPGVGLSCTDCANPVASVTADITYAVLVKTAAGCYSSDSIRVKAKPSVSGQLDTMICTGTTLWWNGTEIAAGSSETFYFPAAGASCDSVFTVQVGTLPVFQTSSSMVVCAGDSVLVFGQYQQVAGSYSQLFLSQQGCDSTHSVQLTVLPILQTADTLTICTGDSIQIFGVWRSLPGAYSQLSASQLTGCDSIHITQLEVLPLVSTSSAMQLCAGDSIQLFGSWVSQPGDYAATFSAQNGCDSMHTVTVSVLPALQTVSAQNICLGDSVWQFNQWYTDPGVYTRTFTASGGCDSTHTFTLAVWPPVQAGEQRQICAGDSSYIFGQWQTETGSYSQTFASIVTGCDSTHTVTLLVAPALSAQSNFQICSGDSVQIFGNWQQLPGTYTQVFTAQGGCDSVHTVVLTVAPIWQTSDQWAICSGDSIQIFGQWRKDSGVYSQLFSTAGTGCDSTHTITLTVQPALSSTTELVHCAGDSSLIFGTWQKQAGVYAQVFTAQGGCDSVHTVMLQVLPVAQTTDSRAICTGDSTLVFGQWQKNAGDYNRAFTAANGCDSTHTIVVVALPLPVVEVATLDPGCQSAGSISVSMGQPLWQYSLDGQQFQPDPVFAGLAAGAYTVFVRDLAGCLSKTVVQLDSTATPILVMPADTSVYAGQMIVLSPEVQAIDPQFEWSPTASLSCAQCPAPLALPGENTIYSLLLTDGNGCTVSGETSVTIVPPAVYVPSVFYPEGTAPNNMFSVFASPGVEQVLVLRVYDRWGGLVYEAQGFAADGSLGWNGQWRGKDCAPGVYVYWLEVKMADGSVWKKSGDITLVR